MSKERTEKEGQRGGDASRQMLTEETGIDASRGAKVRMHPGGSGTRCIQSGDEDREGGTGGQGAGGGKRGGRG